MYNNIIKQHETKSATQIITKSEVQLRTTLGIRSEWEWGQKEIILWRRTKKCNGGWRVNG
jgi:hypothetical protein